MDGFRAKLKTFTVNQLREYAKEFNINKRWRMKKEELVNAILTINRTVSFLDLPNPTINVQTLIPTRYVERAQKQTESAINNYIEDYTNKPGLIKPQITVVNEKLQALKRTVNNIFEKIKKYELKETQSAIKGFAQQHTIEGWSGIDLETLVFSQKIVRLKSTLWQPA